MRISLIAVQTVEGNNVNPPLGLMSLAAVARDAGYNVQLIDVDPTQFDVVKKVRSFNPDLVGLSFMTTEFDKAQKLSYDLRKTLRGVYLCSGGVHTTLDTENVLRTFDIDFCVVGEGELTFLEVCRRIEFGGGYDDVKGVWLIKNGKLIQNAQRELIEDLDSLPLPARDLVDFSNIYLTFPGCIKGRYVRSTAIIAGRGCPFDCNYCGAPKLMGRRYRLRSPQKIVDEVAYLQKTYGVKGILFQDSTFTVNRKWIMSLCREIIDRGIEFVWSCNTRVDTVDIEMLRLMKKAGCIQVEYGIESGSPRVLKILNKGITPEDAISACRLARSVGIMPGASFMLGNPDEDINDLEMTFELSKKIKASYTVFFFTVPYPGTRLWEIAKERGYIPDDISYGAQWNIRASEMPVMNVNIPSNRIQAYRARFQNHFFVSNYIKLNNIIVGLHLLYIMITNPSLAYRGVKRVLRYKRFDSLVEEILVAYRKKLYRYY